MTYEVYVNGGLVCKVLSVEDLLYCIITNHLSIINEDEDLENNKIIIDCEEV